MSKDFIKDNTGWFPVYSSQTENDGMLGKINTYKYDGEYLTWTTDGANAGTVFRRSGKFSVTNVCGLLKIKEEDILNDYLYYALSVEAKKHVNSGMGNPKLMSNVMGSIKVIIPSADRQESIIKVLNSLSEYVRISSPAFLPRSKHATSNTNITATNCLPFQKNSAI